MRERGVVNFREIVRFELESLSVELPAHKRILSYDISLEPLARTTTGKLRRSEIERLARHARPTRRVAIGRRPPANGRGSRDGTHARRHGGHRRTPRSRRRSARRQSRARPRSRLDGAGRAADDAGDAAWAACRAGDSRRRSSRCGSSSKPSISARGSGAPAARRRRTLPWDAVLAEPPDPALVHNLTRSKLAARRVIYAALRSWRLPSSGSLIGLRVTVAVDHVPADGPFIVSPNHQTYLDGFFVAAALPFHAFRRIFFVGAAEYFETPRRWRGARRRSTSFPSIPTPTWSTPCRRRRPDFASAKCLMLFPEGERTIDGRCEDVPQGRGHPRVAPRRAVVPVALDGLFPLWPRGRSLPVGPAVAGCVRRGVRLAFGPPMRFASTDYAAARRARGGDDCRSWRSTEWKSRYRLQDESTSKLGVPHGPYRQHVRLRQPVLRSCRRDDRLSEGAARRHQDVQQHLSHLVSRSAVRTARSRASTRGASSTAITSCRPRAAFATRRSSTRKRSRGSPR